MSSRFRKNLKGRLNGRAEVIISPEKDFSFIKLKVLSLSFHSDMVFGTRQDFHFIASKQV